MIGYVTLGADDLVLAERFYSAILPDLGYRLEVSDEGLSYTLPGPGDGSADPPSLFIVPPWDGRPASAGNGTMLAFRLPTQARVRALHGAGLAAGGRDEGAPGFRAAYSPGFYVGYLRDPQGNKLALYCDSPDEPARPD